MAHTVKRTQGMKTIAECRGCLLIDAKYQTCIAFLDPKYQHRGNRPCWGRCENTQDAIRRLEAMIGYSTDDSGDLTAELEALKRSGKKSEKKLQNWRKTS